MAKAKKPGKGAAALIAVLAIIALLFAVGCFLGRGSQAASSVEAASLGFSLADVPAYSGSPSVEVNGNVPFFDEDYFEKDQFELYSKLDRLGRCGQAYVMVGPETMPTEPRGSIGMVRPSGWKTKSYEWIDGGYLFNRCHLVAFALAGENDNPLNLITGTRSMNTQGMLPFEERVAAYIDATGNHVLYRVTPFFEGDDLVASGVLMEAESVEDGGEGVEFCVWCYNVEPGVVIDYATGESRPGDPVTEGNSSGAAVSRAEDAEPGKAESDAATEPSREGDGVEPSRDGCTATEPSRDGAAAAEPSREGAAAEPSRDGSNTAEPTRDGDVSAKPTRDSSAEARSYVLNTNSMRFHLPGCPSVTAMSEKNRQEFEGTREEAIAMGYTPCGVCCP